MTSKPLEILKRGLAKFPKKIKDRKDALDARLSRKETISSADEHWLDHEANIIDEQRVIDNLEAASDYERGLARLNMSTIGRYVDDLNDPFTRNMEVILGSFSRQLHLDETRTIQSSVLTDFSPRL